MFIEEDNHQYGKFLDEKLSLKGILRDDIEYVFRGEFSEEIVAGVMDLTKSALQENPDTLKIRTKIYYVMGESLQNIARHHSESFKNAPDKYSLFAIHRRNFKYFITTGNLIEIEEIDSLKERIDKINTLKHEDLREYSRTTRNMNEMSPKGGAGLGLIEIAKRSGNKLEYDFKNIDEKHSYFYLNAEIPMPDLKDGIADDPKYSIENIKELHNILVRDNVILFFKGAFNQNSLLNLLSIVESQLHESTITIKIYNLMVEMLQNISRHADNFSKEMDWKPGIFLITETESSYILISGNYILNEKIEKLKENIDYANKLEYSKLVQEYNQLLQDFDLGNRKRGLGLLDLKKKSKENLTYNFHQIDDEISFFMLQVIVKKTSKMNALIVDDTKETPRIHFDPGNNIFEISSRSLPEDADEFYLPVLRWLESYAEKPNPKTIFTFKLDYYNTASARYITRIVKLLDDISKNNEVKVYWYYREIDEDMQAMGEEYQEMTEMDFELIEY
ncbi:MAG: SiaB family protein kinase [Bacteroidales bacterium]